MSRIFVSYAREDGSVAILLAQDLGRAGHDVWLDQQLTGGQAWWDEILSRIAASDAIILCLSPAFVRSVACGREYRFAEALGRHVLPVAIVDAALLDDVPADLGARHWTAYRPDDRDGMLSLIRAITLLPPTPPIPNPLPSAPDVPISYLGTVGARIKTLEPLTSDEQWALVARLRAGLGRQDDVRIYELVEDLSNRSDLLFLVAKELDLIRSRPAATTATWAAPDAPVPSRPDDETLEPGADPLLDANPPIHSAVEHLASTTKTATPRRDGRFRRLLRCSSAAVLVFVVIVVVLALKGIPLGIAVLLLFSKRVRASYDALGRALSRVVWHGRSP